MGIEPISPERQSGRLTSNPNKPLSFLQNFFLQAKACVPEAQRASSS
jgi:hypothetical protein